MKKLLYLLLVPLIYGCGMFKNREVVKSEAKRDSTVKTVESSALKQKEVDKSTVTTTEKTTVPMVVPGFTATVTTPLDLNVLQIGLNVFEDDRLLVSQSLDKQSNVLKTNISVKPRNTPVPVDKQTVEQRDITRESTASADKKQHTQVKKSEEHKQVKATPNYRWIWIVAAIVALYFLYKKFF